MPSHFGADEHPCTTYFDVHQGYRVLKLFGSQLWGEVSENHGLISASLRVMTPPMHTPGPSNGEPRPIPQGPLRTTRFEGPKTIGTLRLP